MAVTAVPGVCLQGDELSVSKDEVPLCFVLRCDALLSRQAFEQVSHNVRTALDKNPACQGIPVVVLHGGMTLELVKTGKACGTCGEYGHAPERCPERGNFRWK